MQCGFCTSGFLMTSAALLREHPHPSDDQLLEAISGNLCRCTGYRNIVQRGPPEARQATAAARRPPMAREPLVGRAVPRVEDERLLRGNGRYVDDIAPPGGLEAAFLRSPHAHARIVAIDVSLARLMPGVHAIFTGADLHDRVEPMVFQIAKIVPPPVRASTGAESRVQPMPALPTERATYVGQPLAVVIADDRYRAEDALELIELELEPLPALVDPLRALDPDAPLLEPEWESNLALQLPLRQRGRRGRLRGGRGRRRGGVPLPPPHRLADRDARRRRPARPVRRQAARLVLDADAPPAARLPRRRAAARARDAARARARRRRRLRPEGRDLPEELVISYVAGELERPVKWIEDRSEHFLATTTAASRSTASRSPPTPTAGSSRCATASCTTAARSTRSASSSPTTR